MTDMIRKGEQLLCTSQKKSRACSCIIVRSFSKFRKLVGMTIIVELHLGGGGAYFRALFLCQVNPYFSQHWQRVTLQLVLLIAELARIAELA